MKIYIAILFIIITMPVFAQTPTPTQLSILATTPFPAAFDGPVYNLSRYFLLSIRPIAEGAALFKDTVDINGLLTTQAADVVGNVSAATFNGYLIPDDFELRGTTHDDRYFTKNELLIGGALDPVYVPAVILNPSFALKSDLTHTHALIDHNHDSLYYTQTILQAGVLDTIYYPTATIDSLLVLKTDIGHPHTESDISDLNHYASPDFDIDIARISTTNLSEGSNLYFTNERVDDRVDALITDGDAILTTYNDGAGTLQVDVRTDGNTILVNGNNDLYVPTNSISHADLLNLATDETHLLYLLLSGSRAMTGDLNLGTFNLTSASGIEIKSDVGLVGGETTKIWDGDKKVLDIGYDAADITLSATGLYQIKHSAAQTIIVGATRFDIGVETDLNQQSIIDINQIRVNSVIFAATTVADVTTLLPALEEGEMVMWKPGGGPISMAWVYDGDVRVQTLVVYGDRDPEHTYSHVIASAGKAYLVDDYWWNE